MIGVPSGGAAPVVPFAPSDIAGMQLWLDAQFPGDLTINTTPNPDQVSAWLDHHTTAQDLAQATSGDQPEYETAGWGGTLPSVRNRNSTSDFLHRDGAGVGSMLVGTNMPWTLALTLQITSIGTPQYLLTFGASTTDSEYTLLSYDATGQLSVSQSGPGGVSNTSQSGTLGSTRHNVICRYSGTNINIRVDGVDVTSGSGASTPGTRSALNRFTLGCLRRMFAEAYSNARFGSCIVYNANVSLGDVGDLETYLAARWPIA
jgi:hypothetical protein